MPVLRMPQDNSLAETLGGLGQSLATMWNPKTRFEAYLAQQRLAMEQEQAALLRKKEESRQLALQHFSFLSREDQGVVQDMIYNDQPMDQILATGARLANKTRNLDGAPADVRIKAWNEMYPGQPWKEAGAPVFGAKDQAEEAARVSKAAGDKVSAEETARSAAADAHTRKILNDPNYPKPGDVSPDALERRARAYADLHPQEKDLPNDGIIPDGSPQVAQLIADRKAGMSLNDAIAKNAGEAVIKGTPLDKPAINAWKLGDPIPLAGGGQITTTAPTAAAPTGPKPKYSDYADPNRPYAVTPAMESVVNGQRITGPQPGAVEGSKALTDKNLELLLSARDEGMQSASLLPKLQQLRGLASMLNSAGPGGQFDIAIQKKILDTFGVSISNTSQIYQAMDQLLKQQIPDLRKQAGFQRMAGIDLPFLGATTGTANLPTPVLMNILANEEAVAQTSVDRKNNALRTLGYDRTQDPLYMPDYQTADTALTTDLSGKIQKLREAYGAIGTTGAQPSTPMPTKSGETTIQIPVPTPKPGETPAAGAPPPGSFYKPVVDPLTGKSGFQLITPQAPAPAPAPVPAPAPATPSLGGNP